MHHCDYLWDLYGFVWWSLYVCSDAVICSFEVGLEFPTHMAVVSDNWVYKITSIQYRLMAVACKIDRIMDHLNFSQFDSHQVLLMYELSHAYETTSCLLELPWLSICMTNVICLHTCIVKWDTVLIVEACNGTQLQVTFEDLTSLA